jgi:hypothetical protein
MAAGSLDAEQCAPVWMLHRELRAPDETRARVFARAAGDLGRQRQVLPVQQPPGHEIAAQVGSALDENEVRRPHPIDGSKYHGK